MLEKNSTTRNLVVMHGLLSNKTGPEEKFTIWVFGVKCFIVWSFSLRWDKKIMFIPLCIKLSSFCVMELVRGVVVSPLMLLLSVSDIFYFNFSNFYTQNCIVKKTMILHEYIDSYLYAHGSTLYCTLNLSI